MALRDFFARQTFKSMVFSLYCWTEWSAVVTQTDIKKGVGDQKKPAVLQLGLYRRFLIPDRKVALSDMGRHERRRGGEDAGDGSGGNDLASIPSKDDQLFNLS